VEELGVLYNSIVCTPAMRKILETTKKNEHSIDGDNFTECYRQVSKDNLWCMTIQISHVGLLM